MKYVLGVDGGGSKVVSLLANERGELLGYGMGGPVNSNYVLYQEASDSLYRSISTALQAGGLRGNQVDAAVLSVPINPAILEATMSRLQLKNVIKAAEGETPRWAARFWTDLRIGVTVDAGTGSLSRGWSSDGQECGAGGFGVTLGDEGSGLWISMKAIIAVIQAYDGRAEPTLLTQPVLDYFGAPDVLALIFREPGGFISKAKMKEVIETQEQTQFVIDSGVVLEKPSTGGSQASNQEGASLGGLFFKKVKQHEPLTRVEVAGLCPVVVDVARRADPIAIQILKEAGRELGRLAVAVIRRLGMQDESFAIVPYGGVIRAGRLVLDSFTATCMAVAPHAKIILPRFGPEVGAVLIALDEIGIEIKQEIIHAVELTSGKFPALEFKEREE
jgi:N-acetylglucosamine kinase-like BadF-type ATPase